MSVQLDLFGDVERAEQQTAQQDRTRHRNALTCLRDSMPDALEAGQSLARSGARRLGLDSECGGERFRTFDGNCEWRPVGDRLRQRGRALSEKARQTSSSRHRSALHR